jgi:hypothetical protein
MKSIGSTEKAGSTELKVPPKENPDNIFELCQFPELSNMIPMKLSNVCR